ncbi:MAG TPA: DCC1-like thiol-disulfide oxidoreductase family protein [Thermoanaerobaculia bacterium]|jgi:predicted DCC family thiol-disulfide oxidoreductase YuxK|nr:DCC1-like thiol-disulfide oxidoreductase family protein [Thermoanaerobaculia bacterium]
MRPHRPLLYFLLAPLAALPVFMANALLQARLAGAPRPALELWRASKDAGFTALVLAYIFMLVLGMPTIFFLRSGERFHRRSLDIAGALLGCLVFLPWWMGRPQVNDWKDFLSVVIWLAAVVVSGFLAFRVVWRIYAGPAPAKGSRLPQPSHAVLTVLYDGRCALCRRVRMWLEEQPKYVTMAFVEAGSAEARKRFPDLDHDATLAELTVVGWGGEVYRDAKGWVMCLWALKKYRSAALRLSTPELMPVARRIIAWVSKQRFQIAEAAGWTK